MNTIKSQEEWLIMKSFRECYSEFPKGKLNKGESPDFILKLSITRSIGIELTRLTKYQPTGNRESNLRTIIHRAQELYKEHFNHPVFVQVFFSEDFSMPLNDELYATKISILVIDTIKGQNLKSPLKLAIEQEDLPPGINRIIIYSDQFIKNTSWDIRSEFNVQDLMNNNLILDLVKKKESKLKLYQKQIHDFYWLIISADYINKPASFNFENAINQLKIESSFNKIILFNLYEQKHYKLV